MGDAELRQFPLLCELPDEHVELIAEELDVLEIGPGYPVFQQGSTSEGLVWVARGSVVVGQGGAAEETLGPGATLGALSLVIGGSRELSAQTASRSRLYLLRPSAYARLRERAPATICALLEAILRENAELIREAAQALAQES